jgi:hypothetical protein
VLERPSKTWMKNISDTNVVAKIGEVAAKLGNVKVFK